MSRNITVGIDIGTRSTRVVVSEYVKGARKPVILGVGVSSSCGLRHGYVVNKQDVSKSIRSAVRSAEISSKVKIRNAYLSIGGISLESSVSNASTIISRTDSEVTDLDIEKTIDISKENMQNISNKRILDIIPLKFKIDGKEVMGKPQGMKGNKLEVKTLFITCLEQHVYDLVSAVENTGVEVDDIVATPIVASLVALTKKQRTVGCLLANIGAETVVVSVFEDDVPISLQVFPIGSTDITNDIALGLKIPLDEAEQIKINNKSGLHSKRKLDEIIEARLSDIFELIDAHLKKIKRSGLLPGGIIITGGGAGISTIEDFARASLKLPSKIATLQPENKQTEQMRDSSWFVAYGLCIYGLQQARKNKPVEILKSIKNHSIDWIKQFLP